MFRLPLLLSTVIVSSVPVLACTEPIDPEEPVQPVPITCNQLQPRTANTALMTIGGMQSAGPVEGTRCAVTVKLPEGFSVKEISLRDQKGKRLNFKEFGNDRKSKSYFCQGIANCQVFSSTVKPGGIEEGKIAKWHVEIEANGRTFDSEGIGLTLSELVGNTQIIAGEIDEMGRPSHHLLAIGLERLEYLD